ncbi:hypothetical protein [Lysinibacillus sp. 3P01SB]|uniref:hypothetical protein n=1 Tax=Lysinibacillus sp. 3P01SB TaxID=3132284 RepID=UPI0039A72184
MYHHFYPLLSHDADTSSQIDAYIASKQIELSAIENQLSDTKQEASDGSLFNLGHFLRLKRHVAAITSSRTLIDGQMTELLSYINEEALFPQKTFSFLGTPYYSHIDSQAYFLFSPLEYDAFLEKQMFWIIELDTREEKRKIHCCSIGFSAENISSLLQYPMDLQHELEKFETMETIEASQEHMTYCRQRLLHYFGVDDILDLYEIEQSHLLKYIGDPLVLLRTIQKKHNDNRIKLSLQSILPIPINKSTIELVHIERRVVKQEQLRRFWEEGQFTAYTKQLQQTKNRLMETAGISQEQLDRLMEQMPADFL